MLSEGWYEWIKDPDDPKQKQPYFIRLKSQVPMFYGVLTQVSLGLEPGDGDGFVIITAASEAGMVGIHDRRPLVLSAALANECQCLNLNPGISFSSGSPITRSNNWRSKCEHLSD